ncbi:MAG: FkbM family methyltransferase [Elusimicrobiota bacterium]|jgi:FkbM family methyltransferase
MRKTILHRLRRGLAYAMRPWIRFELPGWERLCGPLGLAIRSSDLWSGLPPVIIRGKRHGYRMNLQLEDWGDRYTYFLGRYYDLETQVLLETVLRPGDTFIDIGANIGMLTLTAARRTGPSGRVLSFEPNPSVVQRLRKQAEINGLSNVTVFPIGLGDQNGELPFQMIQQSSGWSTFAARPEQAGLTYKTVQIPVRRADDVLPASIGPRVLVKIDAEGFECRVLRGMGKFLERRPAVITEVEPELLQNAGSSPDELHGLMTRQGYKAFGFDLERGGLKQSLRLRALPGIKDPPVFRNVVWLHPEGPGIPGAVL